MITTKDFSSEIYWSVGSCTSYTNNYGENVYMDNAPFTQQCCLASGNHKVTCADSHSDGWHGGYLEINGVKYCEDFTNGNETHADLSITSPPVGMELQY